MDSSDGRNMLDLKCPFLMEFREDKNNIGCRG